MKVEATSAAYPTGARRFTAAAVCVPVSVRGFGLRLEAMACTGRHRRGATQEVAGEAVSSTLTRRDRAGIEAFARARAARERAERARRSGTASPARPHERVA